MPAFSATIEACQSAEQWLSVHREVRLDACLVHRLPALRTHETVEAYARRVAEVLRAIAPRIHPHGWLWIASGGEWRRESSPSSPAPSAAAHAERNARFLNPSNNPPLLASSSAPAWSSRRAALRAHRPAHAQMAAAATRNVLETPTDAFVLWNVVHSLCAPNGGWTLCVHAQADFGGAMGAGYTTLRPVLGFRPATITAAVGPGGPSSLLATHWKCPRPWSASGASDHDWALDACIQHSFAFHTTPRSLVILDPWCGEGDTGRATRAWCEGDTLRSAVFIGLDDAHETNACLRAATLLTTP